MDEIVTDGTCFPLNTSAFNLAKITDKIEAAEATKRNQRIYLVALANITKSAEKVEVDEAFMQEVLAAIPTSTISHQETMRAISQATTKYVNTRALLAEKEHGSAITKLNTEHEAKKIEVLTYMNSKDDDSALIDKLITKNENYGIEIGSLTKQVTDAKKEIAKLDASLGFKDNDLKQRTERLKAAQKEVADLKMVKHNKMVSKDELKRFKAELSELKKVSATAIKEKDKEIASLQRKLEEATLLNITLDEGSKTTSKQVEEAGPHGRAEKRARIQ